MIASRQLKLVALAALLLPASLAAADEMSDLKGRFQSRDAKLQEFKQAGALGETFEGYIDAPASPSADAKSLMAAENTDRRRLYQLIADKEGATVEVVANRAAQRNIKLARKGEKLKNASGTWITK